MIGLWDEMGPNPFALLALLAVVLVVIALCTARYADAPVVPYRDRAHTGRGTEGQVRPFVGSDGNIGVGIDVGGGVTVGVGGIGIGL